MYHLSVKHRRNRNLSLSSLKTQESRPDLVSGTVAATTAWCAIEVIDVVRAAVSHLNGGGSPTTAGMIPVKADRPGHFAISHCRMTTI